MDEHYRRGVPPEAIQGLLAWAHAERPHVALIASNINSNPTKDYLCDYEKTTVSVPHQALGAPGS